MILSDTLIFRSPTCTQVDKDAAEKLSEIAGIVPEEYAAKMFQAGSNLSVKSPYTLEAGCGKIPAPSSQYSRFYDDQ